MVFVKDAEDLSFTLFNRAGEELGLQYLSGKVVAKDPVEAENWLTKSAGQGNANAQYTLARMYHEGQVVPQNYKAAVNWYTKAAEYGHKHAQHHLGMRIEAGKGLGRREKRADASRRRRNNRRCRSSRRATVADTKAIAADEFTATARQLESSDYRGYCK